MIELPESLRDWARELDGFSDALLTAFAPWLPQLAALVGPARLHRADREGEPEGFDGITRRGRYERLLISEWLLADEEPLEFMRRAATGQHLFTALARETPAQSRCCLVLLDAGPAQLGAPRLAQLALLIVLARRARKASARLLWGVVQAPGKLHEGLDRVGVRALFDARTLEALESTRLEQWTAHLREIDLHVDERWLIGGAGLRSGFASTITITEQPPSFTHLHVEIRDGHPARSRMLELPDDETALRILRDPRHRAPRSPSPTQPIADVPRIWLDPSGRRLFVRRPSGSVIGLHVPPTRVVPPGNPRFYQRVGDEKVLAVGTRGKRVIALTATEDCLILRRYGSHARDACYEMLVGANDGARDDADGTLVPHGRGYRHLTPDGNLLELTIPPRAGELELDAYSIAGGVIALSHRGDHFACVRSGILWLRSLDTEIRLGPVDGPLDAGFAWSPSDNGSAAFYYRDAGQGYRSSVGDSLPEVDPQRERVVGAIMRPYRLEVYGRATFSLLVLVERRTLVRRSSEGEVVLTRFPCDVLATAFSDKTGQVAFLTERQDLWVYGCEKSMFLAHHELEEEPASR